MQKNSSSNLLFRELLAKKLISEDFILFDEVSVTRA